MDAVTPAMLLEYFSGKKKHQSYDDASKLFKALRIHADGEFPDELIGARRPSETIEIHTYRKQIYQSVTMEAMSAIIRSLGKIRRSPDWTVKYERENVSSKIADKETLQQYCEYDFPYHKSVTNWVFSILLKNVLIDANAVILTAPLETEVESNEYLQPYPMIYNSDCVYEFIPNQLAILLSTEQTKDKGKIFNVVTDTAIQRWEQKGTSSDYQMTNEYVYEIDCFPAFRMPGIFKKAYGTDDVLFTSHIQPVVPRLNEAVREYSDMQAEVVQHMFSEKWEYATQKCEECLDPVSGVSTGKIKSGNGKRLVTCTKCNGTGIMGTGPYKKIVLRPQKASLGETPIPTPPAGYIQKQIDIVKLQDVRIENHIYKALSAINMQFLAQVPLNESGKAKEVDRDELNNFVYGIAEELVRVMDELYYIINEYRYYNILASDDEREKQLPTIAVPEKFEILTGVNLMEQLKGIKNAGASSTTIIATEIDYCAKTFNTQPEVRDELMAIFKLDPLPGIDEDEKFIRKQGNGITQIDYVISCNIAPFVRQAVFENDKFYQLPFDKQKEKMVEYAQKIIDANKIVENEAMKQSALAAAAAAKANPGAPPTSE